MTREFFDSERRRPDPYEPILRYALPEMCCPFCSSDATRVIDSRPVEHGAAIRRRRVCESCAERFTTYERLEAPLMVRKRDGTLQLFQADKVRAGIRRALADQNLSDDDLATAVGGIEGRLRAAGRETTSQDIGLEVLAYLRTIDEAAYLRFASVYKEFRDASDFEREAAALERAD